MENLRISHCQSRSFLLSFLSTRALSEAPWDPGEVGGSQKEGGELWMYFCHEVSLYVPLRLRMLLTSCVSGLAWGLFSRFHFSVCLEKADSLLQLSVLAELVPSHGDGSTLSLSAGEQQSRALAKRYCRANLNKVNYGHLRHHTR